MATRGKAAGNPIKVTPAMRRKVVDAAKLAIGPGTAALSVGISVPTFKHWLYTDCVDRTDAECKATCVQWQGHRLARAYVAAYTAAKLERRAALGNGAVEGYSRRVDTALDAGGDLAEIAASGDAAPMAVGISDDGAVVLKPVGE